MRLKLGVRILHPRDRRLVLLAESSADTFPRDLGDDGEAYRAILPDGSHSVLLTTRTKNMKNTTILGAALLCSNVQAVTVTFEDLTPTQVYTGPGGGAFENGLNDDPNFQSGPLTFETNFNPSYGGFWSGFAYSNTTDITTEGIGNQYSSFAGGGGNGSETYAVANRFGGGIGLDIPAGFDLNSVQLSIATFSALYILTGDDAFASRAFGGDSSIVDILQVSIAGTENGVAVAAPVEVDLANSSAGATFGISDEWLDVDLTSLASADNLQFTIVNTQGVVPSYFALDNLELVAVPEPSTALLGFAALGFLGLRRRR